MPKKKMGGAGSPPRREPTEEKPGDIFLPSDRAAHINTERQKKYGHPYDVYQRTAAIWTGILFDKLTSPVEPHEVGLMMGGHKIAREAEMPAIIEDNLDDVCGAMNTVAMVYERKRP